MAKSEKNALTASDQAADAKISGGRWAVFLVIGFNLLVASVMLQVVFRMCHTVRQMVTELGSGAEEVKAAAAQVSSSSQEVAQASAGAGGVSGGDIRLEEEIHAMARQNTENLRSVTELIAESEQKFARTNQLLDQSVAAMGISPRKAARSRRSSK